jgi:hypothetical protein
MSKIYRVTYSVTQEHTSYVYADSFEEANIKANTIVEADPDQLKTEWGADEVESKAVAHETTDADLLPTYRGTPEEIARANDEAYEWALQERA